MANHASEDSAEANKQTLSKKTTKTFVSAWPHTPDERPLTISLWTKETKVEDFE